MQSAYSVKKNAKFSPVSGYCPTGCGLVQLTIERKCPVCGSVFKRVATWDSAVKRFKELCFENRDVLDSGHVCSIKLSVMLGRNFYSMPFSYLKEFDDILNYEYHEAFFNKVKSECKLLKN